MSNLIKRASSGRNLTGLWAQQWTTQISVNMNTIPARGIYTPSAATTAMVEREDRVSANTYSPMPVVLSRGKGCKVWDVDNKEYFDFLAGYSAMNQGHCHPRLVAALTEQAGRLALTSRAFHNDTFAEYLEYATSRFAYDRLLPMNSGAEVVESAVKLARKWAYEVKGVPSDEAKIIFVRENFHGRTMTAISASTDPECRTNFGPYVPGVTIIPYNDVAAAEKAISQPNVAAIMLEPVQGEAGVVIPSDGYLTAIRAACTRHKVLMICDEVQTGIGRTGTMLAVEHERVRPDIVTLGKALSGGMYPVSAVLANSDVMLVIKPGQHGSTFGGNPIANRVAIEALKIIDDEKLLDNSIARGEQLRAGLRQLPSQLIKTVRGRGLMNAIVIDDRNGTDKSAALRLCYHMAEHGLLAKPTHGDRIRLTPPLVITQKEVDTCLEKMSAACSAFLRDDADSSAARKAKTATQQQQQQSA